MAQDLRKLAASASFTEVWLGLILILAVKRKLGGPGGMAETNSRCRAGGGEK